MERLIDGAPVAGSLEAEGVALLTARARHESSPIQKARVRAALEANGAPATWRGRPATLALLFAAILLVGAAISRTSFARQWVGAQVRRLVAWVAPQDDAPVTAPRAAPANTPAKPVIVENENENVQAVQAEIPAEAPLAATPPRQPRVAAPHVDARAPKREALPVIDDEPTLVATAMRALRRDHDPAGAARLLDDYLRRWPNGALIEEALALAIEAANARGDARARTFATTYLRRFPAGRFGEAARRTLASASAHTP
ncbi:MAG TPA: hypothetical protein VH560_12715 [Polyangia bacterium]|nr:hypothetical protein [Polyangia bacterium]